MAAALNEDPRHQRWVLVVTLGSQDFHCASAALRFALNLDILFQDCRLKSPWMLFHVVCGAKSPHEKNPENLVRVFFASSSISAKTFHQKDQNPPAKKKKTLPHKLSHSVKLVLGGVSSYLSCDS